MNRTSKLTVCMLTLALTQGCSTVPYQKTSRVEPADDFWRGATFKQNGEFISRGDMLSEFKTDPRKAEILSGYERDEILGAILVIGGSGVFGYGLGKQFRSDVSYPGSSPNPSKDGAGVLIGAGLVAMVIGIVFDVSATHKVRDAVDLHNSELPAPGRAQFGASGLTWSFN